MSEVKECTVCAEEKKVTAFYKDHDECMKCTRALKEASNDELDLSDTNTPETVESAGEPLKTAPEESRGFGDTLEKVFKATGVDKVAKAVLGDDCGCNYRRDKLNGLFPYSKQEPLEFTAGELEWIRQYENWGGTRLLNSGDAQMVQDTWARVFQKKIVGSCTSCAKAQIKNRLYDLIKLMEAYE